MSRVALPTVALMATALVGAAPAQAQNYGAPIDLGTLGGPSSSAKAIDDSIVVGAADTNDTSKWGGNTYHAFVEDVSGASPVMKDLGTFGGEYSDAVAVQGDTAAGWANTSDGWYHGFAYDIPSETMTDLGTLGGYHSIPTAVDGNYVVGWSTNSDYNTHAFAYNTATSTMTDLGTLGGSYEYSFATAVNNGVVVGYSYNADMEMHAFKYDFNAASPEMVDIGTLTADDSGYSYALAMAGSIIVGQADKGSDPHAFMYDNSQVSPDMVDLGTLPGGTGSSASAVGSSLIAGSADDAEGNWHAFAYDMAAANPTLQDLGGLGGDSSASAVSGSLVVGQSNTSSASTPYNAFAFDTKSTSQAMVNLGTLGGTNSTASDVDGYRAIGWADNGDGKARATLWDLSPKTATDITDVTPEPSQWGTEYTVSGTVSVTLGHGPSGELPGEVQVTGDAPGCTDTTLTATDTDNVYAFSCKINPNSVGDNTLTATYADSGNTYGTSSGTKTHTVAKAQTSVEYTGSTVVIAGQNATFSSKVTPDICTGASTYTLTPDPITGTGTSNPYNGGNVSTTGWQNLAYQVTVSYSGNANCKAATDDTGALVVGQAGDAAYGGGWTTYAGGKGNFGFEVHKQPKVTPTVYKGELVWGYKKHWRYKGTLDTFVKSGSTGVSSGTGKLYWWDTTLNNGDGGWALATSSTKATITYTPEVATKKSTSPATFGISFGYTPTSGQPAMPTKTPQPLKGGMIKVA